MNWIKKLLKSISDKVVAEEDVQSTTYEINSNMQEMMENDFVAREKALKSLGELDPDVMSTLMNTAFMGGKAWPSFRQSWRVIRKSNSTIVISDGLSDPFEDEKIPLGYKIEVCAEATEKWDDIRDSWLFDMVYQVSHLIAHFGNVYEMLESNYKTLSTIVSVAGVPEEWENEDGKVGILLGFPTENLPSHIELNEGIIRVLTIKLLHPSEIAFIEKEADMENQRNQLVKAFNGNHFSSINREAVV